MKSEDQKNFQIDFMGIGLPKCATEWLTACMIEHPEIDFSRHKETNFFLSPTKGITNEVYKNKRIKTLEEYKDQFTNTPGTIKGEFNNHYIFDETALNKVKNTFPEIKIIIALRDPIKYLHSIFWYMKYSNAYHLLPNSLEDALETKNEDDLYHLSHAKYGTLIEKVFEIFEQEKVHIIFLNDIKKNPKHVVKNLFQFLEVEDEFEPIVLHKRLNPTRKLRFPTLMIFVNKIKNVLELLGLQKILNFLMNTKNPVRSAYKKLFHSSEKYPDLNPETEKKLRRNLKPEIEKLENLLDQDLSRWKEFKPSSS